MKILHKYKPAIINDIEMIDMTLQLYTVFLLTTALVPTVACSKHLQYVFKEHLCTPNLYRPRGQNK